MADNTYRSYRNRDEVAYDGDGAPARGPADPLAELARLIGQNDPRNEFSHDGVAPATVHDEAAAPQEWPADERYAEPGQPAEPTYDEQYDERYDPPRLAEPPAPYRAAPPSRGGDYVPPVPPRSNSGRDDARFYAPVEPRYPVGQPAPADYGQQLPAFAAQPHDDYDYDDQEQDDGRYADDEDEAPSGRRRGGLVIIAAVLGLAVLGTAGAFAYRAMFGGSMMPSLPPIIKADTGPNKILPSATSPQGRASDQANASTGTSGEKVVSREEQPVDVPAPPNNAPRVVSTIPIFPAPPPPQGAWASGVAGTGVPSAPAAGAMASASVQTMPASGQVMSPAAAAPVPQPPAAASTEPKKIHTVAIKPDQAGASDASQPAAASASSPPAPRTAAAPKPAAAPTPHVATPAAGGPMSIVPTQGEAAAPAPVRTRTAVAQPMAPAAAPSAAAGNAPPATAGGGYAVQLTSQRSEAEAQSAFHSLAAKYPTQLGGHQPIIRQADLGAKGIYYRALVGPFASMEQAAGLCSSLKAAGGSCIVQRN
jgi:SPOR domain